MKNIFYNFRANEPELETKTQLYTTIPKTKINVDINLLLNRVRTEEKKEKKNKIIYLGAAALIVCSTFLLFI